MNEGTEALICIICERKQADGIHICGRFICEQCEKEMIHTDVKDEKYSFFIEQMKRVWYKKNYYQHTYEDERPRFR